VIPLLQPLHASWCATAGRESGPPAWRCLGTSATGAARKMTVARRRKSLRVRWLAETLGRMRCAWCATRTAWSCGKKLLIRVCWWIAGNVRWGAFGDLRALGALLQR